MVMAPAGDLVSAYSPPLLFATDFTSSAGQTLALDGSGGLGFQGGVNIFGSAHVGAPVVIDRASADFSGVNRPYTVALTYLSRPPNSAPQIVSTRQFVMWTDTSGSLVQTTVGLNGVVRVGGAGTVNATMSGGLAVYRFSGVTQPLGFNHVSTGRTLRALLRRISGRRISGSGKCGRIRCRRRVERSGWPDRHGADSAPANCASNGSI
jgi:hypothetical protein